MEHRLIPSPLLPVSSGGFPVPAIIADGGDKASEHLLEFFAATIRNKNTRAAYVQAVAQFCRWCEDRTMQILGPDEHFLGPYRRSPIDRATQPFYGLAVPTLSVFFGIEIRMYFRDHAPPHFHAFYHDNEVLIDIVTLEIIRGWLSRRALGLVLDWAELHHIELTENWKRAEQHLDLTNIDPLE
jgi:hypothetical protein